MEFFNRNKKLFNQDNVSAETSGDIVDVESSSQDSVDAAAPLLYNEEQIKDLLVKSQIATIESTAQPVISYNPYSWIEDAPSEKEVIEYKRLSSEYNYYSNKHRDLLQVIGNMSKYNIDIDYPEIILLARDAAKKANSAENRMKVLDTKYPNINRYLDYVPRTADVFEDSYMSKKFKYLEQKQFNPVWLDSVPQVNAHGSSAINLDWWKTVKPIASIHTT